MTTRQIATRSARALRASRRQQEVADVNNDTGAATVSPTTVDMSFLSNATYVDGSGVGHVKVNESMDWSDVLPNDTTVHIVYEGSGSTEEVLIIPVGDSASNSTDSSSSGGNSTASPVSTLPTGSSGDSSSGDSEGVVDTGSNSTPLVIVACALAAIAIVAVIAVVVYGQRNRRRAYSEDPSNTDEPFIVGSLPHQPVPQLSMLDSDMTPDLWVEGQYQYSPNMSGLENSLNGTAILSDNNTTPAHHRLTVDAYPFSANTRRGRRGNAAHDNAIRDSAARGNPRRDDTGRGNAVRDSAARGYSARGYGGRDNGARRYGGRDTGALDDISDRGRRRTGTTPVVLYDEDSIEEYNTNSSRKPLRQRPPPPPPPHQQRRRQEQQQQRRDKYATRRDR